MFFLCGVIDAQIFCAELLMLRFGHIQGFSSGSAKVPRCCSSGNARAGIALQWCRNIGGSRPVMCLAQEHHDGEEHHAGQELHRLQAQGQACPYNGVGGSRPVMCLAQEHHECQNEGQGHRRLQAQGPAAPCDYPDFFCFVRLVLNRRLLAITAAPCDYQRWCSR